MRRSYDDSVRVRNSEQRKHRLKNMKDQQGTNIVNPETIKIIRNLRGKALDEGKDRDYYLNLMIEKYSNPMVIFENHAMEFCIENQIIGYEFITITSLNVRGES